MTGVYNPKTFILHATSHHQAFAHCEWFETAATRRCLDRISVPMWPSILSDRLPVLALVVFHTANKLIGRKPLLKRHHKPFKLLPCGRIWYRALSQFSSSYSRLKGRLLTCYAPVCRFPVPEGTFSLDLHVLATSPAFTLSQDQTLRTKLSLTSYRAFLALVYVI